MAETPEEKMDRIKAMAEDGRTRGLSDSDIQALRFVWGLAAGALEIARQINEVVADSTSAQPPRRDR